MIYCFLCNTRFEKYSELVNHIKENHKNINITNYYKNYDNYEQSFLKHHLYNSVKCNLCKRYYRQITDYHLKPKHNISITEYKKKFPNAKIVSDEISKKISIKSSNRRHSKESKNKMSISRKKYLKNSNYIAPVLLMNEEQKKEWKNKISVSTKISMKTPEVQKKLSEYKRGEVWNKGLTIENSEIIQKATYKRMKTLEKKSKKDIFTSKIETTFLNDLEKAISYTVIRQKHIYDYFFKWGKNVDGYIETPSIKIIIEVDGVRWHNYPYGTESDKWLDDYCSRNLIKIFRVWDIDVYDKEKRKKHINKIVDYFIDTSYFYSMQDSLSYFEDPSCVFN